MSGTTKIEWTDATWNPVNGCSRVSEGCRNCYAERMAARFSRGPELSGKLAIALNDLPYTGFASMTPNGPRWTGRVELDESKLTLPFRWRPQVQGRSRRVFVNSMSDLFHEALPDEAIDRVFAVMALTPRMTYQVLTKRAGRMEQYMAAPRRAKAVAVAMLEHNPSALEIGRLRWPLANVVLMVSCEHQAAAEERIPLLMRAPAILRGVSMEPLLGHVDIGPFVGIKPRKLSSEWHGPTLTRGIDWVIVGGESGPGARPMHPDWVRSIRDQCLDAGVPFFFKQWGEWLPADQFGADGDKPTVATTGGARVRGVWRSGATNGLKGEDGYIEAFRVGKKNAWRTLDGDEWTMMP